MPNRWNKKPHSIYNGFEYLMAFHVISCDFLVTVMRDNHILQHVIVSDSMITF